VGQAVQTIDHSRDGLVQVNKKEQDPDNPSRPPPGQFSLECRNYTCQITSCDFGFADCDRDFTNGCEVRFPHGTVM
jgi:hypothetical protein